MGDLGTGLVSLAFWGFLAAVVVGGIWSAVREKEAQHETMRRIVESGQQIDAALIEKVFRGERRPDRDLKIGGLITIFAAPGLVILGYALSFINDKVLPPLLGVAGLAVFVGIGLLVAAKVAGRGNREDDTSDRTIAP